jgi:4-hydroxy-3-polyprenylbenzoate decarboxylase
MSRGAVLKVVVAITGASGSIYGYRLLEKLRETGAEVIVIATELGLEILKIENGKGIKDLSKFGRVYKDSDMDAPTSSGSYLFDAFVVVPCSMKTLANIANGLSSNLVARTADVALKERRKVILVTRETPLSLIHIRNMEKATEAGSVILPACPGFYHNPDSIEELVDHIIGKILDQLQIENRSFKRWGEDGQH